MKNYFKTHCVLTFQELHKRLLLAFLLLNSTMPSNEMRTRGKRKHLFEVVQMMLVVFVELYVIVGASLTLFAGHLSKSVWINHDTVTERPFCHKI